MSSQNLVNASTPGYKKRVEFRRVLDSESGANLVDAVENRDATDFSAGKVVSTGNPTDLMVSGEGFLVIRAGSGAAAYLRSGQFRRDADGRLVTAHGEALQADGGDLRLRDGSFSVGADGVVTQAGEPVGRLDVVDVTDRQALARGPEGGFVAAEAAATPVARPSVAQGVVESSNVSTGDEMVALMAALRRAETGQRLMGVYDDLLGRVLTTFGQQ